MNMKNNVKPIITFKGQRHDEHLTIFLSRHNYHYKNK